MVQAGGWFVNEDETEATADSAENVEALTYVQENLLAGNFQYAAQVEAGWGGEAFGTGKGAMTDRGPVDRRRPRRRLPRRRVDRRRAARRARPARAR